MTLFFVVSAIIYSCQPSESEVLGCYVAIDFKNNSDTICLNSDHSYDRRIYVDDELFFNERNTWSYESNHINFDNFFFNYDANLLKFPDIIEENKGGCQTIIEGSIKNRYFCTGHYVGKYCYKKIN